MHAAFLAAMYDVTAEQVAAEFEVMRNAIIVAVPTDGEIVDERFTLLEQTTGVALDGVRYRRAEITGGPADDARLTVGPDGVTYDSADQLLTVCYEDCVAAVTYPDHAITLFDIDGTTIELSAADWIDGEKAFAAIAAAIPDDVALLARRPFGAPADADAVEDIEDIDLAGDQL